MKLVPTDYFKKADNEALEKICPSTPVKQGINIRREKYMQALVQGDAALRKYFDPNNEMVDDGYAIEDSEAEELEPQRSDFNLNNIDCHLSNSPDPPLLPLFPLVGLKRRKVMYYVPLNVANSSFDALIDTGACLSAILLSLFNVINEGSIEEWKQVELTGVVEPLKMMEKEFNLCLANAICTLEN